MLGPSAFVGSRESMSGRGSADRRDALAATYGCRVSGVDLTPDFVAAAIGLTERVGLTGKVDFRQGSALAIPFPDGMFDLAWSQNVAMNIEDRARYYGRRCGAS